ncbi:UNVERIFIED_CONTAM: hypothetical protein Scaly_1119100 [Sesamum calycinum]|uniref:AT3G52170-like helix-turn-helix domain-containing protein n=1 Tax=Sesamum calycinum TaxID=2727403 RepID=A0AAW2QNG3_9LAMI
MRLIRSVLRPANVGLSRRCQVTKASSAPLCPVIERSSIVHGSNVQWCGRSYAASASSDTVECKKARRRVSKDERKTMVENYVNKYREMNAGKFPTASDAVKDVGGSYYVVRQILQELQYNSKVSPADTKGASLEKSFVSKDETSTKSVEVSQTRGLGEVSPILKMATAKSSSKILKSKKRPQSSISVEESINGETQLSSASADRSKIDEPKSSQHPDPEHTKQEIIHEDKLKLMGCEPRASHKSQLSQKYQEGLCSCLTSVQKLCDVPNLLLFEDSGNENITKRGASCSAIEPFQNSCLVCIERLDIGIQDIINIKYKPELLQDWKTGSVGQLSIPF